MLFVLGVAVLSLMERHSDCFIGDKTILNNVAVLSLMERHSDGQDLNVKLEGHCRSPLSYGTTL